MVTVLLSNSAIAGTLSGLLEGLGIPWPGAVVLTIAGTRFGALAAAVIIGTLFALAYTAGSAVQYALGRSCRHLLDRFLPEKTRLKLDRLIAKYGQAAVLWTRPLAVGNYISIPAGIMRMNIGKFLLYTFAGIWPWAVGMTYAGSLVGQWFDRLAGLLPYAAGVVLPVAVFTGIRTFCRNRSSNATREVH